MSVVSSLWRGIPADLRPLGVLGTGSFALVKRCEASVALDQSMTAHMKPLRQRHLETRRVYALKTVTQRPLGWCESESLTPAESFMREMRRFQRASRLPQANNFFALWHAAWSEGRGGHAARMPKFHALMDCCAGTVESLRGKTANFSQLGRQSLVNFCKGAADSVSFAHNSLRLIHGDLRLDNFLVRSNDDLMDHGVKTVPGGGPSGQTPSLARSSRGGGSTPPGNGGPGSGPVLPTPRHCVLCDLGLSRDLPVVVDLAAAAAMQPPPPHASSSSMRSGRHYVFPAGGAASLAPVTTSATGPASKHATWEASSLSSEPPADAGAALDPADASVALAAAAAAAAGEPSITPHHVRLMQSPHHEQAAAASPGSSSSPSSASASLAAGSTRAPPPAHRSTCRFPANVWLSRLAPPEVLAGRPFDESADLWCLGACIAELVAGCRDYYSSVVSVLGAIADIEEGEWDETGAVGNDTSFLLERLEQACSGGRQRAKEMLQGSENKGLRKLIMCLLRTDPEERPSALEASLACARLRAV